MRDFIVYTAGPIKGQTFPEASEWRDYVARELAPFNIRCASPLRDRSYDTGHTNNPEKELFASSRALMTRDYYDCTRSDMLLINILNTKNVSIGTCMEIAWAYHSRIPTVIVMEPNNVHQHPMVSEAVGWVVISLDEAIKVVKHVLVPEGIQSPRAIWVGSVQEMVK